MERDGRIGLGLEWGVYMELVCIFLVLEKVLK